MAGWDFINKGRKLFIWSCKQKKKCRMGVMFICFYTIMIIWPYWTYSSKENHIDCNSEASSSSFFLKSHHQYFCRCLSFHSHCFSLADEYCLLTSKPIYYSLAHILSHKVRLIVIKSYLMVALPANQQQTSPSNV